MHSLDTLGRECRERPRLRQLTFVQPLRSSHASRAFAAASRRHRERQDTRGSDWDFVWRSEYPGKMEISGLALASRDCCPRCQCHRGSATSARAVSQRGVASRLNRAVHQRDMLTQQRAEKWKYPWLKVTTEVSL